MYTICKTTDLAKMELGRVDLYPWGGSRRVEMLFKIGHDDEALYVNLLSYEENPVAWASERNGEVWNDSCMEFFVSPAADSSVGYFNFEINSNPTMLLHFGRERSGRAPVDIAEWPTVSFRLNCTKGMDDFGRAYWRLSYRIPYALFRSYVPEAGLSDGSVIRANLYRCGSNAQTAHYGVWNPIDTTVIPKPDFHRPEYFGEMLLGK